MSLLSNTEIQKGISDLDGWEYVDGSIKKTFSFDTYMDSISFINLLAKKAEIENHHPDMYVGWCKINIIFTSHDQGGVTAACIKMAKQTDSII